MPIALKSSSGGSSGRPSGNLWHRVAGHTRPRGGRRQRGTHESKATRPSPAMVVACLALFVALGSGAYAAVKLKPNSVKAKNDQERRRHRPQDRERRGQHGRRSRDQRGRRRAKIADLVGEQREARPRLGGDREARRRRRHDREDRQQRGDRGEDRPQAVTKGKFARRVRRPTPRRQPHGAGRMHARRHVRGAGGAARRRRRVQLLDHGSGGVLSAAPARKRRAQHDLRSRSARTPGSLAAVTPGR